MTFPLEQNPLFQKLLPEVQNVASDMAENGAAPLSEQDTKAITQRICEERPEDALDFWMFLSDVEALDDSDDWSDANDCIANLINKVLNEQKEANLETHLV